MPHFVPMVKMIQKSLTEIRINIARVRNCPDITLLNSHFLHDHSHGLGHGLVLHQGISHGVGYGVSHGVVHGVGHEFGHVVGHGVNHFQS